MVIGGGIAGCSTAYHLAKMGIRDVILVERATLSSGTTWHSAGNMETYRDDALAFEMVRYAVDSFPILEQETGLSVGWRRTGRVMYTDREDRLQVFQALPELGRLRGIELQSLSPSEVHARLPIIEAEGLTGGLWVPGDGRVNPTDLVMAYARAARHMGVTIVQETSVSEINSANGSITGIETTAGMIETDTVIVAAGLWSNELTETCGIRLPLYALEHLYLITEPVAGLDRNLPMFLSYDDQLYGREEVGGLIIGCLDSDAIPISSKKLGQDFAFSLLDERWDQFEPYMLTAMKRFPVLEHAGIKMLLNGPESFTPDDKMLLGPVPKVSGLYVLAAMNSNGIALSPAAGRYIAEWVSNGAPGTDVSTIDIRRFHESQATEEYIENRVTEVAGFACAMPREEYDYQTSRDIRKSPLHETLRTSGAYFKSVCGWERPHWFTTAEKDNHWLDIVDEEWRTTEHGNLAIDRSSDVKIGLYGDACTHWLLERCVTFDADTSAQLQTVILVDKAHRPQSMAHAVRLDDGWLLIAGPEQETRLKEFLRRNPPPHNQKKIDYTTTHGCLEIVGKNRHGLGGTVSNVMSVVADEDLGAIFIVAPTDAMIGIWNQVTKQPGIPVRPGGFLAREALRIRAGLPTFPDDIDPFTPLQFFSPASNVPFRLGGKLATEPHKRMVRCSSPWPLAGRSSGAAVISDERVVGKVTSAMRLPSWQSAIALVRIHADVEKTASLTLLAEGQQWPLHQGTAE
ncbi:MAG TPA: FAD-dependent oxidoreductase [Woeseiaceae bacterium]|nr:FAD-dependent oxidoreductase [Woeseiaceae bacterium]